jgi:hypothetical protein
MLAGEQRGRHHDGDLRAGHGGDEGGAQRDLGLAEADIAADQPVHRLAGGEILQHVGDGAGLVLGLGEGEAGAELVPAPSAAPWHRRSRSWRSAAMRISSPAMSRMRCFMAAPCGSASRRRPACPARRPAPSLPKRDSSSMFSTGRNSLSSPS